MKLIQSLLVIASLLLVLIISLLIVMLNPQQVEFDILGLFWLNQSLGLLLLFSFIVGVFFALALTFIPSPFLVWLNKRLQKKLAS